MNPTYQTPGPARSVRPGPVPSTLAAGVGAIVVAAFCGLGTLVLILAGGRRLLAGVLDDPLPFEGPAASAAWSGVLDGVLDDAYGIVLGRAWLSAGVGVVFLLLGAAIWARRNWARVVFTIIAPIGALLWLRDLADVNVATVHVLDAIAVGTTLAALIAVWLGPSNRSVRAAKAARAAR